MKPFMRACVFLCLAAASSSLAKSAEDYLHGGASKYIQGRIQEASVEVEEGLRLFPNDSKLKALGGQLRKMKDQKKEDQGGNNSQGGDGSKEKDKKPPEQGKDGQGKDQQKDQGQDKQKEQEKEKDGKDKDPKEKDKGAGDQGDKPPKEDGKAGDTTGRAAPVPPGQMSKEEAERLLNSYQDDEKREQKNLQKRYRKPVEVEEDW
jgi:Ca-activated chloride channel homolog